MKWALLIVLLASVLPLASWLRRNPNEVPKICMLIGFLPWDFVHVYMAMISFPDWPGHTAGLEFSLIDALALALYFGLPAGRDPLPFRISMALYFIATLASVYQAAVPIAALFYVWQLARMFLVYGAVTKACADPRVPFALIKGMAIGLILEAGYVVFQRFALGMLQARGTLAAQNFLGLMSHFAVFPVFALLLVTRKGRLIPLAAIAGVIVEIFTTSRATVGLAVLGYVIIFTISALRQWTSRKARIMIIGVAAIAVAAPLAVLSFQTRFAKESAGSYSVPGSDEQDEDERILFKQVAAMILADHPWGVGANHYVIAANQGGYNMAVGIPVSEDNLLAKVHHVYWLVAAETGYIGVISFVFLLLQPLILAFRCGWRNRGDVRGDLLLGIGTSLLIVYLHSLYEWIFIAFQCQYMFALDMAMVVGLSRQLDYWRGSRRQIPPRAVRTKSEEASSGRRFRYSRATETVFSPGPIDHRSDSIW